MRTILRRLFRKLKHLSLNKQDAELLFWTYELKSYQQWYDGEVSILHNTKNPNLSEKIDAPNQKDASILTWHKLHQEKKYLIDLDLDANVFHGMKILDIGSGPIPSATCFTNCQVYCLDPLLHKYLQAGYPLHYYENVKFIQGVSEKIPFKNDFFDAVISVNSIDHVDNLQETSSEIDRVLKTGGVLRIHYHSHLPKKCEPISINDNLFQKSFQWCKELQKIKTSHISYSSSLPENEYYSLWSNF